MTKKKPVELGKRAKNDLARLQKSGGGRLGTGEQSAVAFAQSPVKLPSESYYLIR